MKGATILVNAEKNLTVSDQTNRIFTPYTDWLPSEVVPDFRTTY
jgi:hypothetical protein